MHYCCVKLCGKNTKTSGVQKDGISFHRFPKCPKIKEMWINATNRPHDWFPSPSSVICSRHFESEYIKLSKDNNRRLLYTNAVPTLHLPTVISREEKQHESSFPIKTEPISEENIEQAHTVPSTSSQATASYNVQPDTKTDNLEAISNLSKKKHLTIIAAELSHKLKQSRIKVKRLQTANRTLKKKITSLKLQLKEREEKQ